MKFGEVLRRLDAYPKTLEDVSVRTLSGAGVTIISTTIIVVLIFLEYQLYLSTPVTEELFVDTTRSDKLLINLDITIPKVSCVYLTLDAMDQSGEMHPHVDANIFKRRLDQDGNPIQSEPIKQEVSTSNDKNTTNEIAEVPKCGSCYGAEIRLSSVNGTRCCNTCEEVIHAYREMKWEAKPENFEQCKHKTEEEKEELENAFKEGCQIYGYMEVTRMGGNFHLAPGKSFSFRRVHFHEVSPQFSSGVNLTHKINHLSFGIQSDLAKTNPLDGILVLDENKDMTMFQYFIKIVPTMYVKKDGKAISTNQFSVTRDQRRIASGDPGLIALFFSYELSPLMVKYTEQTPTFGHFATNVCSIVGGVFTVAGILVAFLHNSLKVIEKKIELGKLS